MKLRDHPELLNLSVNNLNEKIEKSEQLKKRIMEIENEILNIKN